MTAFLATYDFLLVSMVLAAVLALTLYLPLMAGQLSVASPGFYALGGYVAAILSTKVFHPGPGLYPVRCVLVEMAVAAVVSASSASSSACPPSDCAASSWPWPPSPSCRSWVSSP